jgi:hypothetical protein
MTRKEQLIDLVERLDETQAAEALDLLWARYAQLSGERELPAFVGTGHSGQGDLGRRAKQIVRDELGGRAA